MTDVQALWRVVMDSRVIPFEGRMSYCLTKCLKMVLSSRGDHYPLPFLECVSTEPFGFIYKRVGKGGFAVNGYEYNDAGERLLQLLGYGYKLHWFDTSEHALSQLKVFLDQGPVIVGMLDMGFLIYQPDCRYKRGSDHALVALELLDNVVIVHDPDGYIHVPLPLKAFLEAWKAKNIYTGKSYMLWTISERVCSPSPEEIYRKALELGLCNMRRSPKIIDEHVQLLFGPEALRSLAEDIRARQVGRWLRVYAFFSFRVSGQRCFDSALFIRDAPFRNRYLERAFQFRIEQAARYGEAQLAAATKKSRQVAEALERIAALEEVFAEALEQGLSAV
jgi:hypothetical protein